MRKHSGSILGTRANALWGNGGGRGDDRSNALWGRGGRNAALLLVTALAAVICLPAAVAGGNGKGTAVVPSRLLAAAEANPDQTFHVIVQGTKGHKSDAVADDVTASNGKLKRKYLSISGVSADVSGKDLLKLAQRPYVLAITPDAPVKTADYQNSEMWRSTVDVAPLWNTTDPATGLAVGPAPQAPAVAVVDSGVDASKVADFGSRVVANVNLSSLSAAGAPADEEGHGTMVAGVLAGASPAYPGVAKNAPLVSIRTSNAQGESVTSDVIAAADWILANKDVYNIRVANFSMAGASATSFRFDPLDKAVERLWFSGVVVVAAAGNHGSASGAVDMSFAPGNDPFVITVGATDQMLSADALDDTVPWWSAHGKTMDGFGKPDVSAPGRYIVAPVPTASTLVATVPDRVVAPGYMWMSGTSFSAPIVSGAAAQILARHPDWGPDEVKGALMLTANYLAGAGSSAGVGEIDAAVAASLDFTPPNPNENLYQFVAPDAATGARSFDEAGWANHVATTPGWTQASWDSASWNSASWDSASWVSASWDSASWNSNVSSAMANLATLNEATYSP